MSTSMELCSRQSGAHNVELTTIWSSAQDDDEWLVVKQPLRGNGHAEASPLLRENLSSGLNQEPAFTEGFAKAKEMLAEAGN